MQQPKENGLSSNEEHDRLCEIEDALGQALEDADPKSFTSAAIPPLAAASSTATPRTARRPRAAFRWRWCRSTSMNSRSARVQIPEWEAYHEFLYPSPREYQTILNERVLRNLEKHGDNHEIEREVSHWIYFASPAERDRFQAAAIEKGYKIVSRNDDGQGERKFGLTVSQTHAVDFRTINDIVLELFDLAGECGGDYDGWETKVESIT